MYLLNNMRKIRTLYKQDFYNWCYLASFNNYRQSFLFLQSPSLISLVFSFFFSKWDSSLSLSLFISIGDLYIHDCTIYFFFKVFFYSHSLFYFLIGNHVCSLDSVFRSREIHLPCFYFVSDLFV